jgi:hypothetical protein
LPQEAWTDPQFRAEVVAMSQWLRRSALFGLKMGLNDAFVIDENESNELIETMPSG